MGLVFGLKFGRNLVRELLNALKMELAAPRSKLRWYPQSKTRKWYPKQLKPKMELTRWEKPRLVTTDSFQTLHHQSYSKKCGAKNPRDRKNRPRTTPVKHVPVNPCWSANNNSTRPTQKFTCWTPWSLKIRALWEAASPMIPSCKKLFNLKLPLL